MHYDAWYFPSQKELRLEWSSEYDKMRQFLSTSFFDDENRFVDFLGTRANIKMVRLPLSVDENIRRRTFCSSIDELERMVSTYRSAARRKGVPTKLAEMMEQGEQLPTAIIMRRKGKTYVVGGNTRLDVCRILHVNPDPLVAYYDLDRPDIAELIDHYEIARR